MCGGVVAATSRRDLCGKLLARRFKIVEAEGVLCWKKRKKLRKKATKAEKFVWKFLRSRGDVSGREFEGFT